MANVGVLGLYSCVFLVGVVFFGQYCRCFCLLGLFYASFWAFNVMFAHVRALRALIGQIFLFKCDFSMYEGPPGPHRAYVAHAMGPEGP